MPVNVAHTPRQQTRQTATSFLLAAVAAAAGQPQVYRWSMQFSPSKDKLEIDKEDSERGGGVKRGKRERNRERGRAACTQLAFKSAQIAFSWEKMLLHLCRAANCVEKCLKGFRCVCVWGGKLQGKRERDRERKRGRGQAINAIWLQLRLAFSFEHWWNETSIDFRNCLALAVIHTQRELKSGKGRQGEGEELQVRPKSSCKRTLRCFKLKFIEMFCCEFPRNFQVLQLLESCLWLTWKSFEGKINGRHSRVSAKIC